MKARRAEFLLNCLEKMQDEVSKDDPDLMAFYENCLQKFSEKETLTISEIRECDKHGPERKKSDHNRTYKNRLLRLSEAYERNRQYFKAELELHGLNRFPKLRYERGGGYGKESSFTLDVSDYFDWNVVDEASNSKEVSHKDVSKTEKVEYLAKKISRPPWYLKAVNPLFQKQKSRVLSALSVMAVAYLILPMLIAYILIYTPVFPLVIPALVFLMLLDWMLAGPALKIFHLITRKITILETLKHPPSTVCISELDGDDIADFRTAKRKLSTVTITGDCPVCKAVHNIGGTVWLEQRGLRRSQIIGVCVNNPMMHQFSFDKDLMLGERIHPV